MTGFENVVVAVLAVVLVAGAAWLALEHPGLFSVAAVACWLSAWIYRRWKR